MGQDICHKYFSFGILCKEKNGSIRREIDQLGDLLMDIIGSSQKIYLKTKHQEGTCEMAWRVKAPAVQIGYLSFPPRACIKMLVPQSVIWLPHMDQASSNMVTWEVL